MGITIIATLIEIIMVTSILFESDLLDERMYYVTNEWRRLMDDLTNDLWGALSGQEPLMHL